MTDSILSSEGLVEYRHQLLVDHLIYNHYPSLPISLVKVAEMALDHYAEFGDEGYEMQLPDGITFHGVNSALIEQVFDTLHLYDFLESVE
jgi:hypothetical protein